MSRILCIIICSSLGNNRHLVLKTEDKVVRKTKEKVAVRKTKGKAVRRIKEKA